MLIESLLLALPLILASTMFNGKIDQARRKYGVINIIYAISKQSKEGS